MIAGWFGGVGDWADKHSDALIVGGLGFTVAVLVLAAVLVRRLFKSKRPDKILSIIAVVVGFGWSAEAMWEIATQVLHLSWMFAGLAFFVFEVMLATSMTRAERASAGTKERRRHVRGVFVIALIAGTIAAIAGDSWTETVFRFALPLLVARQWRDGLPIDGDSDSTERTPYERIKRRAMLALGLVDADDRDVRQVHRDHRIGQLARTAHRYHHGRRIFRRWHGARLRRLALTADEDMIAAARDQVDRVHRIASLTDPKAHPGTGTSAPAESAPSTPSAGTEYVPEYGSDPESEPVPALYPLPSAPAERAVRAGRAGTVAGLAAAPAVNGAESPEVLAGLSDDAIVADLVKVREATGTALSLRAVKARYGVGQARAARVLAQLDQRDAETMPVEVNGAPVAGAVGYGYARAEA